MSSPGRIRLRCLLIGLPAILAGGLFLAIAGARVLTDKQQLRARYFQDAVRKLEAKDYGAALIGFQRVVELDGATHEDRQVQYRVAVCLEALGEHQRADRVIDRLAPANHAGYAEAHAWKAQRLLAGRELSPAKVQDAESQLLLALEAAPDTIEVHDHLGEFYLATGRPEKAIPYLEKIAVARPDLLMTLARALRSQGRHTQARQRATAARAAFQKRAEADLTDFGSRLRWVEAAVFLEDFPSAVEALRREAALGRGVRCQRALSQVYTAWADALERRGGSDLAERLDLLEKGLEFDPSNQDLIGRFAKLIRSGGEGEVGRHARAALESLVARGRATGPVLFALGLDAWTSGRRAEACVHWEEANRLDPRSLVVANNLACALAAGPDPDLARALATINPVIALRPDEPRFRETRGQILAKLRRWEEALPDLKAALTAEPDSPDLHRALAETYANLDAPGIAAEHRRRAGVPPQRTPTQ